MLMGKIDFIVINGLLYLNTPLAQQRHSVIHPVGIGKPQVHITIHAQSRNGIEAVQCVALEYGTTDAGGGKPAQHFIAGGGEKLLLLAHGLVIAEPLQAQFSRRLAGLGQTQRAVGHQPRDALLLRQKQQRQPLAGCEGAEKSGVGRLIPQAAAQQLEQLGEQRRKRRVFFHEIKNKGALPGKMSEGRRLCYG